MIVIPLVVASLLVGTASLGDLRKVGRIGGKTLVYYMTTTAGIITLIIVLQSVGLADQVEVGIALILGVDRILDMLRTSVNVTGDITASAVIARSEGEVLATAVSVTGQT